MPLVGRIPLHPHDSPSPLAEQFVAFIDTHDSFVVSPELIVSGLAVKVTSVLFLMIGTGGGGG